MPDSRDWSRYPPGPSQPEPPAPGWRQAPGWGRSQPEYGRPRVGGPPSAPGRPPTWSSSPPTDPRGPRPHQAPTWNVDTLRGPTGRPRPRWLLPAAAALALLLACGGTTALLSFAATQATRPIAVARQYCAALHAQNYRAAYALTSSATQKQTSKAWFTTEAQLHDGVDGKVTRCAPVPAGRDAFGDAIGDLGFLLGGARAATVTVTIVRTRLGARTGTITMTSQGGSWTVGSIADALQGTPLGPLLLANHFCTALAAGDFKTAFGDLSAHQVSLEQSEANFARQATLPAGSKYTGCAPDLTTYHVAGATASVKLALDIQVTTPAGTSVVPVASLASFVQEKGAWKLDGLDPPSSAS